MGDVVEVVAPFFMGQPNRGMESRDFLCRNCGFRGPDERFRDDVRCPECGSSRVVLAEAWDRYGSDRTGLVVGEIYDQMNSPKGDAT